MEQSPNQNLLFFFVRHGERIDQVKKLNAKEKNTVFPKCDPPLTEAGKQMGFEAGSLVKKMLQEYKDGAYSNAPV